MLQKKDKEKILFFRESIFKVAELIFNYPNKTFHIRELTRKTNFSTTAVTKAIEELNKYNIVTIETTQLTKNVKANLESEEYRFYKLVFNLYRLEKYNIINILISEYRPEAIVLFGSFAKGEDTENSDIDILVITPGKEIKEINIEKLEKEFNRKINLHILQNIEKSSTEFKNSIANGIVLYGYIKVI
ncbi:nucleotidyltransferase domain-containing protein [Candidatus Woesearchaeota archaeon]|nr:nucleotidyltransferase domain-containing protein [Candidatus Woesearchaeota archaeon]